MTTFNKLYSISYDFYENYNENLEKLIRYIDKTESNSVVTAPELCLTNYSFNKLDESVKFGEKALEKILPLSQNRLITFTLVTEKNNKYFNTALTLYKNKIIHSQSKHKLFKFGDEHKYFSQGNLDNIDIFEVDGIRFAKLICFELRFIELWKRIQGADIIMIPALWGKLRKKQLEIISQALAVVNQSYVIVSNSTNADMAASSAIITPFGERILNDNQNLLSMDFDKNEVRKMRRYMDIGLS